MMRGPSNRPLQRNRGGSLSSAHDSPPRVAGAFPSTWPLARTGDRGYHLRETEGRRGGFFSRPRTPRRPGMPPLGTVDLRGRGFPLVRARLPSASCWHLPRHLPPARTGDRGYHLREHASRGGKISLQPAERNLRAIFGRPRVRGEHSCRAALGYPRGSGQEKGRLGGAKVMAGISPLGAFLEAPKRPFLAV